MLKLSQRKILTLLLCFTVSLCLEDTVKAQQPNSASTPLPLTSSTVLTNPVEERIKKLEQRVQKIEGSPKDFWDKAESTSGWGVAFIGAVATYVYDKRQKKNEEKQKAKECELAATQHQRELAVSRVQTINSFLPQLQSRYIEDVEIAIKLVVALGDIKLAISLLERYETGTAIRAPRKIAFPEDSGSRRA